MNIFSENQEVITRLVGRVMRIESVTSYEPGAREIAVFRGKLRRDSAEAYDFVADEVRLHGLTPVFRAEGEQHVIGLVEGVIEVKPSNPWVNLILFVLTLFSVIWAGTLYSYNGPLPEAFGEQMRQLLANLQVGLPYGLSILAILLAHEFGHYLAARYHKAAVTLPYFFPFPFSQLGTLGAFIQLKSPPKNKRILHDIGVAGPLAGLVVAIPILLVGLALSPVEQISLAGLPEGSILTMEGNSIIYLLAKYVVHGQWLPAPADYGGLHPLLYWIRYIFTGYPTPLGAQDVMLHPMAWAGWAGLLVTALNLIPVGQLDGGHTLYVLLGKKAKKAYPVIIIMLGLLGLVWPGWWLWVALIYFFGQRHAEPLDQITELDSRRRLVATFVLVLFFLLFTPIPLAQFTGPNGLF
jgi:membrane-associated protease RseP (regulator of RpoE activity)